MAGEEKIHLPIYPIPQVASYLQMPATTLRAWVLGTSYSSGSGPKRFKHVIQVPDPRRPQLSFVNLVEAHVLDAIRRKHKVSLQKVRKALDALARISDSRHPLAEEEFRTDGVNLFVERYGNYISLDERLQIEMKALIGSYLERIEYASNLPVRLYPFTRLKEPGSQPKLIAIDPSISFGEPTLAGTGIKTSVIVDRFLSGERPEEIAVDYLRSVEEIDEAIRWELLLRSRHAA